MRGVKFLGSFAAGLLFGLLLFGAPYAAMEALRRAGRRHRLEVAS